MTDAGAIFSVRVENAVDDRDELVDLRDELTARTDIDQLERDRMLDQIDRYIADIDSVGDELDVLEPEDDRAGS